jgi:hypothetical protein
MVVLGGELETLVAAAAESSVAVAESEAAASKKIAQSAYVIQAGLKTTTDTVSDTAGARGARAQSSAQPPHSALASTPLSGHLAQAKRAPSGGSQHRAGRSRLWYGAAKWTQRVVGLNVQHRPRLRDRLEHVHRLLSLPALVVSADEGTVSSSGVIPAGRLELEA